MKSILQKSLSFLIQKNHRQGTWADFSTPAGISFDWVTAYIGHHIFEVIGNQPVLDKAHIWLESSLGDRKGWGYHKYIRPDADSTANGLLFLSRMKQQNRDTLIKVADFLIQFQNPADGGFRTYLPTPQTENETEDKVRFVGSGWCQSHLSVTAMATEALYWCDPKKYKNEIDQAITFMMNNQNQKGFWEEYWWNDRLYGTYRALRALNLLNQKEPFVPAAKWILNNQQPDGSWNNGMGGQSAAFYTALALASILLMNPSPSYKPLLEKSITWLAQNQKEDGSFESVPILRVTDPHVLEPWKDPEHASKIPLIKDQARLFTTATVFSTLGLYQKWLQTIDAS